MNERFVQIEAILTLIPKDPTSSVEVTFKIKSKQSRERAPKFKLFQRDQISRSLFEDGIEM